MRQKAMAVMTYLSALKMYPARQTLRYQIEDGPCPFQWNRSLLRLQ